MTGQANLKAMSIDKLLKLREQIDATLATKIADERRSLQAALGRLSQVGSARLSPAVRGGARGKVAPKYRNPDDPSETWAGRGLKPRWLTAAIKAGRKLEHFVIGGKKAAARPTARKGRKLKGSAARRGRVSTRGSTVAPKYRNPENSAETWAGRGLKPRWLTEAMKAGKKLEQFAIAAVAKKGPVKRSRKPEQK